MFSVAFGIGALRVERTRPVKWAWKGVWAGDGGCD